MKRPEERARCRRSRARRKRIGFSTMVTAERLRVVDADMNDVTIDGTTMGEIVMHGNGVTKGYFRDEEATELAFAGGWFHSGDLGVIHPNRYVELIDRVKDIVISGGENTSSVQVGQMIASLRDTSRSMKTTQPSLRSPGPAPRMGSLRQKNAEGQAARVLERDPAQA